MLKTSHRHPQPDLAGVTALTASVDEAIRLLRQQRYSDLDEHFRLFQQQAQSLEALRQSLENGSVPPAGLEQSCAQLGKTLFVFSQVAREVATVESGMLQLTTGPAESSYGRDGHCETGESTRFQQEA